MMCMSPISKILGQPRIGRHINPETPFTLRPRLRCVNCRLIDNRTAGGKYLNTLVAVGKFRGKGKVSIKRRNRTWVLGRTQAHWVDAEEDRQILALGQCGRPLWISSIRKGKISRSG
jgi:hypothetical protein